HSADDHHDALAALRAAEAEAARLLRSGPPPVAVSGGPGDRPEHDDLGVVSAPVTGLEDPLARLADIAAPAGVLVVTGDPGDRDGGAARQEALERAGEARRR